jgi:RNA polymerase sigma-70 factor (ECF subfamily)
MDAVDDRGVWLRLLDGDADAFGVVWDRHRDRVFRRALSAGNSPTDAEDLTAMVFLELWRKRSSVRFVDGSLLPWLLVTTQNVHLNASRARRRHRRFLERLPHPEHAPDPADLVAEKDSSRARWVREVLSTAREQDRHLAVLTTLEGFTIREAAEAIGISESAAKMRLSRLRTRLSQTPHDLSMTEGSTP